MELQVKIIADAGQARKAQAFINGEEFSPFGAGIVRALCGTNCYQSFETDGTFRRPSGAFVEVSFPEFPDMLTADEFLKEIVRRADAVNAAFEEKYPAIDDFAETEYEWPAPTKTGRRK